MSIAIQCPREVLLAVQDQAVTNLSTNLRQHLSLTRVEVSIKPQEGMLCIQAYVHIPMDEAGHKLIRDTLFASFGGEYKVQVFDANGKLLIEQILFAQAH